MPARKAPAVDDTAARLQQFREIVSAARYRVITANSGKESVAKTRPEMPNLVFFDIVMDDLNGYGARRLPNSASPIPALIRDHAGKLYLEDGHIRVGLDVGSFFMTPGDRL